MSYCKYPDTEAVLSDVTALYHDLRVREGASHRAGGTNTALYDALGLVILSGCEKCANTGTRLVNPDLEPAMVRHFTHVMDEDVARRQCPSCKVFNGHLTGCDGVIRCPPCPSCGKDGYHATECPNKPDDFDTSHLTGKAKEVADAIVAHVRERVGPTASGGGCRAFRTTEEWKERGELYGLNSILIVVYDGGDLGYFFDYDHQNYGAIEGMSANLKKFGVWSEACTGWYSATYID